MDSIYFAYSSCSVHCASPLLECGATIVGLYFNVLCIFISPLVIDVDFNFFVQQCVKIRGASEESAQKIIKQVAKDIGWVSCYPLN